MALIPRVLRIWHGFRAWNWTSYWRTGGLITAEETGGCEDLSKWLDLWKLQRALVSRMRNQNEVSFHLAFLLKGEASSFLWILAHLVISFLNLTVQGGVDLDRLTPLEPLRRVSSMAVLIPPGWRAVRPHTHSDNFTCTFYLTFPTSFRVVYIWYAPFLSHCF